MNKNLMLVAFLAVALAPSALATNGYFTHGTGTLSKGMAGAALAIPREALDTAANPAAAAWIEDGYTVSLALFSPDRTYTIDGNPSGYPQTFGLTPGAVTSESTLFPMPAAAGNYQLADKGAFAWSMLARGGMNTDYRTATFYGADHTGVDLAQMFLNATYARKLAPNHSLGLSLIGVGQRFKASGLEAFGQMSHDPQHLTGNGYDWSYGLGLQLGYLGKLHPRLSAAATWTPRISMSNFEDYNGLFEDHGSFDIPGSYEAGLAFKATDSVTLAVDYQRVEYSAVDSVGNHLLPNLMQQPLGLPESAGFGWDDVDVIKVGIDWQATPVWGFSAGYSKCNQPIPSSEVLFNILAPGVIEQHLTVGVSRSMGTPGRFNVAFMYAPSQSVTGANPLEAPGQQQIELEMSEWELEFGYNF